MWKSALNELPPEDMPVACWEKCELFTAKRVGGYWHECSTAGDVYMSTGGGSIIREVEKWTHLPGRVVKLKRKPSKE